MVSSSATSSASSAAAGEDGPEIKAIETVTTPALVGICLGTTLFLVTVAAVTCFCYRRHSRLGTHKKGPRGGRPEIVLRQCRRLSAVKSPATPGSGTHYLKKSPSPTGSSRSPPGGGGSHTPSPTNDNAAPSQSANSPIQESLQQSDSGCKISPTYHTENELRVKPTTPSKEELETNEKNLTSTGSNGKLGQLIFKLRHDNRRNALIVTVVKCNDLPASDPYVKIQIFPDMKKKKNTRMLRNTRNPVYNEEIIFYNMDFLWLKDQTIHFLVMSFDRYSRDDVIGEVFCELDSVDLSQIKNQSLTFCREIQPRSLKIGTAGRGELLLSLCWQPCTYRITVVVLKARNLPTMDVTGLADPYVKIYLLYNDHRIAKKKTRVVPRTLNPVFNECFVFTLPPEADGLDNISLEVLLLDWDRITKNEVIGRLTLGAKGNESASHHWIVMNNSPRRQIADWHKLEG